MPHSLGPVLGGPKVALGCVRPCARLFSTWLKSEGSCSQPLQLLWWEAASHSTMHGWQETATWLLGNRGLPATPTTKPKTDEPGGCGLLAWPAVKPALGMLGGAVLNTAAPTKPHHPRLPRQQCVGRLDWARCLNSTEHDANMIPHILAKRIQTLTPESA